MTHIRVPASSANLGPGYDTFGLALDKYDEVHARRTEGGLTITVSGVGAGAVPTDESHLVFQAAARTFEAMDLAVPGIEMHCVNTIPHGGGQGSSAAGIVSGILMARALTDEGAERFSDDDVFALATRMEGHPDNVAPVLAGGFTMAWMSGRLRAHPCMVRLAPRPEIDVILLSADDACQTSRARAALPEWVPHRDAAQNSARAALMAHAMAADPSLLFDATEDWLHQGYRAAVMPRTAEVLQQLRSDGYAAVLSGAGPSILILGADLPGPAAFAVEGYQASSIGIPGCGATVDGKALACGDTPGVAHTWGTPVP